MSKTFYAEAQTGVVAVMNGDIDMDVINNPINHSDQLYFHSSFLYLYKIGTINNTVNLPAMNTNSIIDSSYDIGQIYFPDQFPIIPLITYNGTTTNGSFLLYSLYQSCRYATVNFYYAAPFINFRVQDKGNAFRSSIPSYSLNINIDVYSARNPSTGFEFTPTSAVMGSFDSKDVHLKFDPDGYPLFQKQAINLQNTTNIMSADYSTDGYGVTAV